MTIVDKFLVCVAIVIIISGCASYTSKEPLYQISKNNDPDLMELQNGHNSYVKRSYLKDGTEIGIIETKDGNSAKYWFRSHHLVDDMGGTWFSMSDGTVMYMAGWFCCEVQLPKKQFKTLDELKTFIKKHHGIHP